MNVTFIGSGNVAWHLAPALDNTDYPVREVYSRNARHAEGLVNRLYQASVRTTLDFSNSSSKIFVIAVSDDAIPEVVREIVLPDDAILVHTSGSQSLGILEDAAAWATGVFYPLQTFSKNRKLDFQEIPIFVEASDGGTEKLLTAMARAISGSVHRATSVERKTLHIAAVFASNFTNHMLTLSQDVLKKNGQKFEWLKPLIAETVNKALTLGPEKSQTGPARRGDLRILDMHMEALKGDERLAELYRVISQHILDGYEE